MNQVTLMGIKNLIWDYYHFYKDRNKEVLIKDLKNVIIYIEQIIRNLGGKI